MERKDGTVKVVVDNIRCTLVATEDPDVIKVFWSRGEYEFERYQDDGTWWHDGWWQASEALALELERFYLAHRKATGK